MHVRVVDSLDIVETQDMTTSWLAPSNVFGLYLRSLLTTLWRFVGTKASVLRAHYGHHLPRSSKLQTTFAPTLLSYRKLLYTDHKTNDRFDTRVLCDGDLLKMNQERKPQSHDERKGLYGQRYFIVSDAVGNPPGVFFIQPLEDAWSR